MKNMSEINWTQRLRRKNLKATAEIIKKYGGYPKVLGDMHDFERYLAFTLGCSIKTAKEYISTVRGASLFLHLKSREGEKI